jgi:hypothetical protein
MKLDSCLISVNMKADNHVTFIIIPVFSLPGGWPEFRDRALSVRPAISERRPANPRLEKTAFATAGGIFDLAKVCPNELVGRDRRARRWAKPETVRARRTALSC